MSNIVIPLSSTTSYIYYPTSFNSKKDIVVSFDYQCKSNNVNSGEGFNLFFVDKFFGLVSGGGPGKALGYTNLICFTANNTTTGLKNFNGIIGGSLGIGFDLQGNYALSSVGVSGYPIPEKNSICLRGSYLSGYNVLYRTKNLNTFTTPLSLLRENTFNDFYRVRIRITDFGKRLLLDIKSPENNIFTNYVNYSIPYTLPDELLAGISFGSSYNKSLFKIKNFNINAFIAPTNTPTPTQTPTQTVTPTRTPTPTPTPTPTETIP